MNELILLYDGIIQSIVGVSSFLLDSLTIVLIVRETPKAMGPYKWLLLNLAITDLLGSILVEWCVRPAILTSNAAIIIQGPLKYFGQDYAIFWAMLFMAGLAWVIYWMSISFIYRYATVANNRLSILIFSQRAAAFAGVFGILACLLFAALTWTVVERDYELLLDLAIAANPRLLEFEPEIILIGLSNPQAQAGTTLIAGITIGVAISVPIVICTVTALIVIKLRQCRTSMTPATFKLQHQLVVSLSIQCLFPTVLGVFPVVAAASCFIFGCSQSQGNVDNDGNDWIAVFCLNAMISYTSLDAIVTIAFVGPYRRAVLKSWHKFFSGIKSMQRSQQATEPIERIVGRNNIVQPRQSLMTSTTA